jgi:hypothetical protein
MRNLKHSWVIFVLLCGCASLGLEPPQDLGDRLAYAEGMNTALRDASTDALNHHEITSNDMEHVRDINKQAKVLLSGARLVMDTDPKTAEGRLLEATKLLTELQNYLRARGVKTGEMTWKKQPLLS